MTPPRITVAFLSSCVRGGGAGWSLYYLIKHLDRSVVEPIVVVPDEGIFAELYRDLGVELVIAPELPERTARHLYATRNRFTESLSVAQNLWGSARSVGWLAHLLRARKTDLVYCNNMAVKPVGAAAAQLARVPCVLHARNLHESWGHQLLYCQSVARLTAVRRVIANSQATAAPYRAAVPNKVNVVYNGVDLAEYEPERIPRGRYRAEHSFDRSLPLVGFTGNLIARKGLLTLVRAAGLLHERGVRAHFAAVGRVPIGARSDYLEECKAEIARLDLQATFHFTGFMKDVRSAVVDFDVLVLPSLQEPFGRSIIEALALGTPVIASRVGGIPEIIDDGRSGLLVPPQDAPALANALERVLADPELRQSLADGGRATVRARFDVHALTRRMQTILSEAASARAACA
jgi:glycosyltransferase involved in cell wall biosynthesis